jgi:6-phosphofructokinase 1
MAACVSASDAREAVMAGRAAVRYALEGATDAMVTLVRGDEAKYACTTGLAPLEQVAGQVKRMPDKYLDTSRYGVTEPFLDYARPLIGPPLPRFGRLR